MRKTTLYLPNELQRQLQEAARRSGRSQADLLRAAVTAYLREEPRRLPRFIGAGDDPELSSEEAKGWMRVIHPRPERWP